MLIFRKKILHNKFMTRLVIKVNGRPGVWVRFLSDLLRDEIHDHNNAVHRARDQADALVGSYKNKQGFEFDIAQI